MDKCFGLGLRDQIFAQARARKAGVAFPGSLSGAPQNRARGKSGKAGGRKRLVPPLTTRIPKNCFLDGISQDLLFLGTQLRGAVSIQGFGAGKNTYSSTDSVDFRAWRLRMVHYTHDRVG